jgi:hypothetical protein
MLEAFGRGIVASRGVAEIETVETKKMRLVERKHQISRAIGTLTYDQRLQVLMAIAQIAGLDAIREQSNGCFVDVTSWDDKKISRLAEVIEFVTT